MCLPSRPAVPVPCQNLLPLSRTDRVFEISVAVLLALPPLLVGLAHSPVYLIKGGGRHAAGRGAAYATFGSALLCGTMHRATVAGLPTAIIFIGVCVESWLAWAEVPAPAKSAAEFRIER